MNVIFAYTNIIMRVLFVLGLTLLVSSLYVSPKDVLTKALTAFFDENIVESQP